MMKDKPDFSVVRTETELLATMALFFYNFAKQPSYQIIIDDALPPEDQLIRMRDPVDHGDEFDLEEFFSEIKHEAEVGLHVAGVNPLDLEVREQNDHYIYNVIVTPRVEVGERIEDQHIIYEVTTTDQFGREADADYRIIEEDDRQVLIFTPFNLQYEMIGHEARINLDRVHAGEEFYEVEYQFTLRQEEDRDPHLVTAEIAHERIDAYDERLPSPVAVRVNPFAAFLDDDSENEEEENEPETPSLSAKIHGDLPHHSLDGEEELP
ncbi:MAG: hypothetical protein RLN62_03090 [Rickettsiales bacterium]